MSNTNIGSTVATVLNDSGNAASTLTTGTVTTYFQSNNVPGEALLAGATISLAAETASVNINLGSHTGNAVVPTRVLIRMLTGPTFTSGSSPTITAQIAVGVSTTSASDVVCSAATALVSATTVAAVTGAGIFVNMAAVATASASVTTPTLNTVKLKLAFTGSPTNGTAKFKIYLFGVSEQPVF